MSLSHSLRDVHGVPLAPEPPIRLLDEDRRDSATCRALGRALLGDDDPAFRHRLLELLKDELFDTRDGLSVAEQTELAYRRFRTVVEELGLDARDVVDPARLFAVQDWLGLIDPTACTVMSIHYALCMGSVLFHGEGREELFETIRELESLESVGVFLATELGYGNNVVSLQTRAVYDPAAREFVIDTPCPEARKFMPNTALGGVPKLAIVFARLESRGEDHGVFPFVVRLHDGTRCEPGVHVAPLGSKPGYVLDNAITSFASVRVPKRNLLTGGHSRLDDDGAFHSSVRSRRERFLQAIDRVQLGRLCLTGGAIAVARAAAWVAIRYGQQRMTFAPGRADVPILRYRNVQRDVFGALADAFALTVAMARARRLYRASAGGAAPALSRTLAAFKAVATYACADAVAVCRERCGAAGMFDENRLLGFWTQIQGLITAEGDNQIVLLKAARQMLAREHYEPPEILEQPQPARRSLADPAFQAALLRQRERGQLAALDAGVADALARGDDLFDAWNDHVNPALELARSHGVRFVFEEFDAAVERVAEISARRVLRQLCSLFALREIARSSGWLLAEGALTPAQVKALPRTLDDHCAALLPYADELTACWGLSNELLRVPIASADYVAAYDAKARRAAAAR